MNTQSYPATRKQTAEECVAIGDYIFNEERDYIYIVLPNKDGKFATDSEGRAVLDPIRISRSPSSNPRVWTWNGNEDKPSLSPSIDWRGHWHGYLTNGELKSC